MSEALARAHAPTFVFHSRERYWPTTLTEYMSACALRRNDKQIAPVGAPLETLAAALPDDRLHYTGPRTGSLPVAAAAAEHTPPVRGSVPVYAWHVPGPALPNGASQWDDIVYCLMFAYSGGLGPFAAGAHTPDIERVVIRFVNGVPSSALLGRHSGAARVQLYGGALRAFVARHSHAMYERAGTTWRAWGFANDHCDEGTEAVADIQWLDVSGLLANDNNSALPTEWRFRGYLEKNAQRLPLYRGHNWMHSFVTKPDAARVSPNYCCWCSAP